MPDPLPIRDERPVVIHEQSHTALWVVTLVSLGLNLLILGGLLGAGAVHHLHHGPAQSGGGQSKEQGFGGGFQHERHFGGGMGMRGGEQFGRGGFGGGMGGDRGDFGGDHHGMGMMNGMGHDGMGRGGMGQPGTPPDPAAMTNRIMEHLTQQLTLTDDEKTKIMPVIQAQVDQMQKDREAEKAAHEKAMADTKAKIRALLTPDQQKQLDAMKGPGKDGGPGAGPEDGGPGPKPGE